MRKTEGWKELERRRIYSVLWISFTLSSILLVSAIPLSSLWPELNVLFQAENSNISIYAALYLLTVAIHLAFVLRCFRLAHYFESRRSFYLSRLPAKIIENLSSRLTLTSFLIGTGVGVAMAAVRIVQRRIVYGYVAFMSMPPELLLLAFLYSVLPILEELVNRVVYFELSWGLFGHRRIVSILSIVASSVIFTWMHAWMDRDPTISLFVGSVLAALYVWRKSLFTNSVAHGCLNLILGHVVSFE